MVQILVATYNGEKYVEEQIMSLLNQTYQNIQILIRDDNSSDDTKIILKNLSDKYSEKIVLIDDDCICGSAQSNFMRLMRYATSEYIMFCDQDDYWFPEKVQSMLKIMKQQEKKDKGPILIYSDYQVTDENLNPIRENKKSNQIYKAKLDINHLLVQNYITGCTIMVNKELYEHTQEYKKEILMHDWWLAIYAATFGKIKHYPRVLMYYRQHGNNCVGAVNVKSLKYIREKAFDKNVRKSNTAYVKQAARFYEFYGAEMSEESKQKFLYFLKIPTRKKIMRILMLCKGHYFKSTFLRIVGQLRYI